MRFENMNDNPQFPFFPHPAQGETVYSVFGRVRARTGLPDDCITTEFTGQPRRGNSGLFSGLPSFIPQLASKMPTGHPWRDKNIIVANHTTLPYFIYFDPGEERRTWSDKFAETSLSQPLKMSLGISNNPIKALPPHPRYCPTCVEEDLKVLGYPYFKREHQLPGVVVCWRHGTVLANGCSLCGPYPIKGRAFSMAGQCLCAQGIVPLQFQTKLPENTETLLWIAKQSAIMVNSSGTGHNDVRLALRKEALNKGLGGGAQVRPSRLAEAIEKRFGSEILEWLGTPVFTEGRPSLWISRLFWADNRKSRRAPIFYLLVIGTLYGSLERFERDTKRLNRVELIGESDSLRTPQVKTESIRPAWTKELHHLLQSEQCGLNEISRRLGVSVYKLIGEVELNGWRVILSDNIIKKYGAKTIADIKKDLQSGVAKKDIIQCYSCSEWMLRMVELDDPSLKENRNNAINQLIVEKHRNSLLNYLANNALATRNDIKNSLPSTYRSLVEKDKEWFYKQIPTKKKSSNSNRIGQTRIDWGLFDRQKQVKISEAFDKMLATSERPVQATTTAALKLVGLAATFYVSRQKLPLVAATLEKRAESYPDFVKRRISWAVAKVAESGAPITLKNLTLAAALRRHLVKDHKSLVVDLVKKLNAKISSRSFFS